MVPAVLLFHLIFHGLIGGLGFAAATNANHWINLREAINVADEVEGFLEGNSSIEEARAHHHQIDHELSLSDNSHSSWEESFRDSSRFWVQRVLVPLVVLIGVMGNAVTIYILTRRPMRSSTNVYLTALAVSDLLFLLFSFSMSWRHYPSINTIWLYWYYTPFGLWITDASSSTSVWIIVSFTVERYIAVCHPMRGKTICTEERAMKVAAIVYIISFALTATTPFEWQAVVSSNYTDSSNNTVYLYTLEITDFGKNDTYRLLYHWFITIFVVFLPVVILAIFNFFLIQTVRRSRIARKGMTNQQLSTARQLQILRQENRITKILIVVVIVFLICQMPTALILIYTSVHYVEPGSSEDNILRGLGNIFNLLVAVNAACNFLLYTALSDKYRKYFCNFFLCRHRNNANFRNAVGRYDEGRFDTAETTFSFTRGSSLRCEYNSMGYPRRNYMQGGGELKRANTYASNRNRYVCSTAPRSSHHNSFNNSIDGGERNNFDLSIKDSTIPLIKIEQV